MRTGYRQLIEAMVWLGKNKKVDVTRSLGGVLEPGIHTATVVEFQKGKNYTDFILESEDKKYHKERVWDSTYGKPSWTPALGSKWKFELWYGGDGKHHIEAGSGASRYFLIDEVYRKVVYESDRISNVYSYVRDNNIKLKYLRIKWRKPL